MKKLLIATACAALINPLCATEAVASEPSTNEVKRPFIANGGFHGLCDRLEWTWGYIDGNSPACFSGAYAMRNGYVFNPADNSWTKSNP